MKRIYTIMMVNYIYENGLENKNNYIKKY